MSAAVPMTSPPLRFQEFALGPAQFELRRAGHRVRLERKPLELLILLAEKRGNLVSREEIIQRVWGDDVYFDAERGVNNAVRKIRAALHAESAQPQFVETIVGKGYRFIAPVNAESTRVAAATPSPSVGAARATSLNPEALNAEETSAAGSSALPSFSQSRPGRRLLAAAGLLVAMLAIVFFFTLGR